MGITYAWTKTELTQLKLLENIMPQLKSLLQLQVFATHWNLISATENGSTFERNSEVRIIQQTANEASVQAEHTH